MPWGSASVNVAVLPENEVVDTGAFAHAAESGASATVAVVVAVEVLRGVSLSVTVTLSGNDPPSSQVCEHVPRYGPPVGPLRTPAEGAVASPQSIEAV